MTLKARPKQKLSEATDAATSSLMEQGSNSDVHRRNKVRIGSPTSQSAHLTNQLVHALRNRGK